MTTPSAAIDSLSDLTRMAASVETLSRQVTCPALLDATARELVSLVGADGAVISRLDGDVLLEEAACWPRAEARHPVLTGYAYLLADYPLTRAVIETASPRVVSLDDDLVEPSEAFVLRELGMRSVLMLPLVVAQRPWGLVEVYEADQRRFAKRETTLGELFVRQAAGLLAQLEQAQATQALYRETLASLANALEQKDAYTSKHAQQVVSLAVDVAERLGVDAQGVRTVELGALLHDIGKIHVPESILNKPAALDEEEWLVMRRHPEAGEAILAPLGGLGGVLPIVRSSHERWDGGGYPDGLAGEAIPLGARIVAVCDAYRAMIEARPYRPGLDRARALAELRASAGRQFDPRCVLALVAVLAERARAEPADRPLHRPAAAV